MANKRKDLSGTRFPDSRLEILRRVIQNNPVGYNPVGKPDTWWEVRCDCGTVKLIHRTNIKGTRSCGCIRFGLITSRSVTADIGVRNVLLFEYKKSAKKRGLVWNLTKEIFFELVTQNCHYCGRPPQTARRVHNHIFSYNGVDRKNNDFGYEPGNVVPCCKTCQYGKRDLPYEEFVCYLRLAGAYASSISI